MSFAIKNHQHRALIKLLQQYQRGKLRPQLGQTAQDSNFPVGPNLPNHSLANQHEQRKTLSELMRDSDHNFLIL